MARKKRQPEPESGGDDFMLMFTALMIIVLAFFILLTTMAVIAFVGMFLPILWPIRARPEDKGLAPDGIDKSEASEAEAAQKQGIVGGIALSDGLKELSRLIFLSPSGCD